MLLARPNPGDGMITRRVDRLALETRESRTASARENEKPGRNLAERSYQVLPRPESVEV